MEAALPTLKEIAKRLNVSVSTVSRALAGHPRIGLGTRMKVQKLASELGYEPNRQAIHFKQKRTFIIGVIIPFIREEFFSNAISGIEDVAISHNYTMLFGQSHDDVDTEKRLVEVMKKQRVDGLIISLSKSTAAIDHIEALSRFNIPVVYFDRVPSSDNVNKVYCDILEGTSQMVSHLLSKGIRRIALLNGPDKLAASKDRLNGYIKSMVKFKLKADMRLVETTDFSRQSTYEAMQKIMSLKAPPQAVISFNDYVHMDAVTYAKQHKIKINKDVVFASFANLPITGYTTYPPLVALEQYPFKQGEAAMNMLLQIIDEKLSGNAHPQASHIEMISPALVEL